MTHLKYCVALATLLSMPLYAQDADESGADDAAEVEPTPQAQDAESSASPDQPRAMSGMSILGNEEAPKALVIIPWKSSELGDEIGMPEQLDDKANPVDREVFLRELRFHDIRQGGE